MVRRGGDDARLTMMRETAARLARTEK